MWKFGTASATLFKSFLLGQRQPTHYSFALRLQYYSLKYFSFLCVFHFTMRERCNVLTRYIFFSVAPPYEKRLLPFTLNPSRSLSFLKFVCLFVLFDVIEDRWSLSVHLSYVYFLPPSPHQPSSCQLHFYHFWHKNIDLYGKLFKISWEEKIN